MADNVTLNAGTGGAVAATADIAHSGDASVQLQLVGLMGLAGTEGAYTATQVDGGNGVAASALRVTLASDSTGVVAATQSGTWNVTNVSGTVSLPTGAATAAKQPALGTAGTASADVISVQGIASMTPIQVGDNSGSLTIDAPVGTPAFVRLSDGAAAISTLPVSLASVPSHAVTNAGTFQTQESGAALTSLQLIDNLVLAEDAAAASGDPGVAVLTVRQDTIASSTSLDGDYQTLKTTAAGRLYTSATVDAAIPAGTNNIGDVDVLTVPADPFGVNADAASATGSISAKLRFIAATGIPVTGTVTVANGGTFATQAAAAGVAAHDAAISGNPVRIAGRALTSDYTAVAAGDTADLITTLLGKLVTIPYANPNNTWSYAAASGGIVNTTGVTIKAAGGAGVRLYVTDVQIINGHATVSTDVQIRDGAAGTVLYRGFAQAAGGGVSVHFAVPLRGTANTLLEVACGTTGSATYVNVQGYSAAE